MALVDMKSNLAKGIGSRQSPQSFQDGHSGTTVTGAKTFPIPPRTQIESKVFSAVNRQGEELKFQFDTTFVTPSLQKTTVPKLQKYYDRAFKNSDPLGARNNDRLGFDEPFILKGIGDRWGPGGLGKLDLGLVRAGVVTQAARTVADVIRIGKFLLTPRGIGFAIKQDILQKMNAGGEFGFGTLGAMLGQKLGKPVTLNAKQQRFSTGRDVFRNVATGKFGGQGYPTVDEMKGSDIRTWRPTSLIDSLPIGAHYVRHKVPAGSPSIQLVKNIGNFLVDSGDGVLKFIDGIDVAFPHVSLNPNFQAGSILSGAGKAIKGAANGIADIFPNIGGAFKIKKPKFDIKIGATGKPSLGRMFSLTSQFPFLINIPTPRTPNLSGIQNILGALADTAASLLKGIGGGIASTLGGISLPSISLPPLPNFPSLPDISLPNLPNPFSAIGNAVKGISIGFPKFGGKGGLNLGAVARGISSAFPSIRLNADVSLGSMSFDLAAFDEGKASFQAGLKNLLTQPDALNAVGANNFGRDNVDRPKDRYGIEVHDYGADLAYRQEGLANLTYPTSPELYYTTAQPSVGQDTRGSLRNVYDVSSKYENIVLTKYTTSFVGKNELDSYRGAGESGVAISKEGSMENLVFGINLGDTTLQNIAPFALAAGFISGQRWGVNPGETDGHLNTKKGLMGGTKANPGVKPINFPDHVVNASKDRKGNRIQRYEMLSYGQLGEDDRYEDSANNADLARGIGSQGGAGRLIPDPEIGVVRMSDDGKYSSHLQDKINLHPYGGSTISEDINDTNIDFIPFKFRDMVNGKWIIFRAILESVSDTSSPEYAEESYIGRPDKVYVYKGSSRNFNVTFKVMPKSIQELITIWEKLNYLRGLTYPTIKSNRMIAPFASITVGDMVDKLPVLLQSLNYSVDTASTWEVKPGLRLPKLIQISTDMRVIEPKLPQTTGKFYDLDWLKDNGEFGTFDRDPSRIASLSPKRVKYEKGNHNSRHKWPHLFDELGISGVTPDILASLIEGDDAIAEMKEDLLLKDEIASFIDFPNPGKVDIPNPATDFSWKK